MCGSRPVQQELHRLYMVRPSVTTCGLRLSDGVPCGHQRIETSTFSLLPLFIWMTLPTHTTINQHAFIGNEVSNQTSTLQSVLLLWEGTTTSEAAGLSANVFSCSTVRVLGQEGSLRVPGYALLPWVRRTSPAAARRLPRLPERPTPTYSCCRQVRDCESVRRPFVGKNKMLSGCWKK